MHRGDKFSDGISDAQAKRLLVALLYFISIGKWPNRFATIHLKKAGVAACAHPFLAYFLKQARDWLRGRRAGSICFGYVFENHGALHVHIIMHVPNGLWDDLVIAQRQWLKRALKRYGGRNRAGVLRTKAVYYYEEFIVGTASQRDYLKRGLRGLLLYLLKGAHTDNTVLLGLYPDDIEDVSEKSRPSDQGIVTGRRVGVSQNLSKASVSALRPNPWSSWLEDAERAAEVGASAHLASVRKPR